MTRRSHLLRSWRAVSVWRRTRDAASTARILQQYNPLRKEEYSRVEFMRFFIIENSAKKCARVSTVFLTIMYANKDKCAHFGSNNVEATHQLCAKSGLQRHLGLYWGIFFSHLSTLYKVPTPTSPFSSGDLIILISLRLFPSRKKVSRYLYRGAKEMK